MLSFSHFSTPVQSSWINELFFWMGFWLKCPYYGLRKVHILVLGVPNNRLTCMQGQKTLSFSYNMHLFLPYLLNDSLNDSFFLLCMTLICGDWSDWSISFKAAFVSAVLLCVQLLPGKQLFLTLQKVAPSGKEWICIFIQTNAKIKFSQVCARNKWAGNMLMFLVDVNMKWLGIRFKNDLFQLFRVDSFFWETITLYTVHFQI